MEWEKSFFGFSFLWLAFSGKPPNIFKSTSSWQTIRFNWTTVTMGRKSNIQDSKIVLYKQTIYLIDISQMNYFLALIEKIQIINLNSILNSSF